MPRARHLMNTLRQQTQQSRLTPPAHPIRASVSFLQTHPLSFAPTQPIAMTHTRHAIFLNGPIGSGKTTLGRGLADRLAGGFIDGDDFSAADRPWYCSIHSTSKAIVREGLTVLMHAPTVVIAYPLGCVNWIYYRRHFTDAGVRPFFVNLRASYLSIVAADRGRAFSAQERQRIKVMIDEGYAERRFSDLTVDTDQQDFAATLDHLERTIRERIFT